MDDKLTIKTYNRIPLVLIVIPFIIMVMMGFSLSIAGLLGRDVYFVSIGLSAFAGSAILTVTTFVVIRLMLRRLSRTFFVFDNDGFVKIKKHSDRDEILIKYKWDEVASVTFGNLFVLSFVFHADKKDPLAFTVYPYKDEPEKYLLYKNDYILISKKQAKQVKDLFYSDLRFGKSKKLIGIDYYARNSEE